MSSKQLTLSTKGMMNIAISRAENDFTFIVGEHRHSCPWFVADFLSPKVGRLHSIDPCLNEIIIDTIDYNDEFGALLTLGRGSKIEMTETNRTFLNSISLELCNAELYFTINEEFAKKENILKCMEELLESELLDYIPNSDPSIDFLASHFFEIDSSLLTKFPVSLLTRIVSNHSLRIESEDSLYEIIHSRMESDPNSIYLLEYLRFEFVTCESMTNVILWSFDHFEQIAISLSVWEALSRRLVLRVVPCDTTITEYRMTRLRSPTSLVMPEISHDGIIAHLTRESGGNVHDKGIVDISAKAIDQNLDQFQAKHAANFHDSSYFQSSNSPDQWIQYDFKTHRVRPTHYAIFPHCHSYWLRSWVLEGSLNGSNDSWDEVDRHDDDTTMNIKHPIGTFAVTRSGEYRFIRLRQTGKNHGNNDYMVLYSFEIFGDLIEPSLN
jgi:hypothetical protein